MAIATPLLSIFWQRYQKEIVRDNFKVEKVEPEKIEIVETEYTPEELDAYENIVVSAGIFTYYNARNYFLKDNNKFFLKTKSNRQEKYCICR